MKLPQPTYLADYAPPDFRIETADLAFDLYEENTIVTARLLFTRQSQSPKPLVLQGEALKLLRITLDDQVLTSKDYKQGTHSLTIASVPDTFVLTIETQINPAANTRLMGLFKSGELFCTQCEPQGFRRMTYFLDRPDVLARFTTYISADKCRYPYLLSNGNVVEKGELKDGRHFVKWADPFKKPSYLFALVAGDLDCLSGSYTTQSGRVVSVQIFANKGERERCQFALEAVYHAMRWDEQTFGREYDLDVFMIVAVHDFNMGAMENKGLNIFNAKYILADPKSATDSDFQAILSVIGHEYFHNWSGNRVTCRDWFQLSLKEGLTIFRDQTFSQAMGSELVNRIRDVNFLRTVQFTEDAGPMAHPVQPDSYIEINNFYTATVYHKGAELIRMLRTLLGKTVFRQAMDRYFSDNDGKAVTIEDFVHAMEVTSGIDLEQFRRWYKQSGTPWLNIHSEYDPKQQTFTLKVTQTCPPTPNQPTKQPFSIPLAIGLLNSEGKAIPPTLTTENTPYPDHTRVLNVTQPEEIFCFRDIKERPVPSLLRHFSGPVNLEVNYSDTDRLFLALHDSDGFGRWEATQQIALRTLQQLVAQFQQGITFSVNDDLCRIFEHVLNDTRLDKAFAAELLTLPSEAYIGEHMTIIDVDAIYAARRHLHQTLGKQLASSWFNHYQANQLSGDYRHDLANVAARSLKNTCLAYLLASHTSETIALAFEQFQNANNMTDSLAALTVLASIDSKERVLALDAFYHAWENDTLVLDKWFNVQASANLPNRLELIKTLMQHPRFDQNNPNKLRALIGGFCQNNRVQFHDHSGEGYRFVTDQICRLNTTNPQVASRLLEPFTQWQRFDAIRQAHMRTCLTQIKQLPHLSPDIYEVVDKSAV